MKIRHAEPEDVGGLREVFYRAWLVTYPNEEVGITKEDIEAYFKNSQDPDELQKRADHIRNLPPNHVYLVAEEAAKIVGLLLLVKREVYDQLQAIYILPEHHGKGIGTSLFNEALTHVTKDMIVQVATYNANAIRFYEKLGFVDNGKRFTEERHRMPVSGVLIPEMEMLRKLING